MLMAESDRNEDIIRAEIPWRIKEDEGRIKGIAKL